MLVRARNIYGSSEASSASDYIITSGERQDTFAYQPPVIEQNLKTRIVDLRRVSVLSSTALNVTWRVRLYYIRTERMQGEDKSKYSNLRSI